MDQGSIDPNADVHKAVALYAFGGQNEDELTVEENEEIEILVRECDEEGWVMARNASGTKGYVPQNYIEIYASVPNQPEQQQQYHNRNSGYSNNSVSSTGQVVRQVSVESTGSWGLPAQPEVMPVIPESMHQPLPPPPATWTHGAMETEEEEEEDEEEEEEDSSSSPPPGTVNTLIISQFAVKCSSPVTSPTKSKITIDRGIAGPMTK